MEKKEFKYAFQINRTIVFEVNFYTLGSNKRPYFSTSASQFNQPKTDYDRCGQSQKDLLKPASLARQFFDKWDKCHLHDLTDDEYEDIVSDIEGLKRKYNYVEHLAGEPRTVNGDAFLYKQKFAPLRDAESEHPSDIKFWECKKLSMMPTKEKMKEMER